MATHQDLLEAINRIRAATGDRNAWQSGLSGDDVAAACNPFSSPTALGAVLTKIVAAHPDAFLAGAGPGAPAPPANQGLAAEAIRNAETALAHQNSTAAQVDLKVVAAVLNAHSANAGGAAELDRLQREIEAAVLSRTDLDTPAGAREFQRFLIGKLREIRAVVDTAGLDATSKAALAAALAALYASATPEPGPPPEAEREAPQATSPTGDRVHQEDGERAVATDPLPADLPWTPADVPELTEPAWDLGPLPAEPPYPIAPTAPPLTPAPAMAAPAMAPPAPAWGAAPAGGGGSPVPDLGLPQLSRDVGVAESLPDRDIDLPPRADAAAGEGPNDDADQDADQDVDQDVDQDADEDAAAGTPQDDPPPVPDPSVVELPDGQRITAPSPQIAAAITAAVAGTPIPEAFRQQGIILPPAGSPVSAPVDPGRLAPGDVGVLADRHALALGNGTALLDNQIQPIADVGGLGFLGWQHPPGPTTTNPQPPAVPAPTRPVETAPS